MGRLALLVGETGTYSVTLTPPDATPPVDLLWSNGDMTPETIYSWEIPGTHTVAVTATNASGLVVVTDTLQVEVNSTTDRGRDYWSYQPTGG